MLFLWHTNTSNTKGDDIFRKELNIPETTEFLLRSVNDIQNLVDNGDLKLTEIQENNLKSLKEILPGSNENILPDVQPYLMNLMYIAVELQNQLNYSYMTIAIIADCLNILSYLDNSDNNTPNEYVDKEAVIRIGRETGAWNTILRVRDLPTFHSKSTKIATWTPIMMSEATGWDLSATGGHDEVCEYVCSQCGKWCIYDEEGKPVFSKYCPNCGIKMEDVYEI